MRQSSIFKTKYIFCTISLLLSSLLSTISAQNHAQEPGDTKINKKGTSGVGIRQYDIIVNQTTDTLTLNTRLRHLNNNRSILSDIATGYLSLGTSTLLSASKSVLDIGMSMIKEAARDKRPDWEKAVREESTFVKFLPMQTQVLDFYGKPSNKGALDPIDMKFKGFGCRQVISVNDSNGTPQEKEVFYLSCRVRDDDAGLARMLHHSKFEVIVDELRFNPYLCNLPNDSVNPDQETRVDFSFDNRKNLTFKVDALISSSWINEAIQVHNNVNLGKFTITALINPDQLDSDGTFSYRHDNPEDNDKTVSVIGDCFLVPRSYVGSDDMKTASDTWGTGQYKVDMLISESCQINENFYTENKNGKRQWVKSRWSPEWQRIRKRKPGKYFWQQVKSTVTKDFKGEQWITTISEPITSNLLSHETILLNKATGNIMPTAKPTAMPSGTSSKNTGAVPSQNPNQNPPK